MARIGKIAMAASIYIISKERNQRIFLAKMRTENQVMKEIEEWVRAKAWNWMGKRNLSSWVVCKSWGLDESNLL